MSKSTTAAQANKSIQIITLNGSVFLGQLSVTDNVTTIQSSLCVGAVCQITKKHLADYICAENLGTLDKDTEVTGQAMFSRRDLSDDLALELDILRLKFAQAEKSAPAKAVNAEFKALIGG